MRISKILILFSITTGLTLACSKAAAQSNEYLSSPLHRDLTDISKKLDQANSNAINSIKGALITSSIMSGLKTLGNSLENQKFKDASEDILITGDWKIYTANTGLGPLTVVYGGGKFAVLINSPSGPMTGKYDETSSETYEKGRLKIDLKNKKFTTNPIFGSGENSTLTLINSSANQNNSSDQGPVPE